MLRLVVFALALSLAPTMVRAGPRAPAQPTLPAQNVPGFTAGAWRGGPVADGDGQVQACAMFAPAGRGMQMFFRLSSGFDFSLGLVNQTWRLTQGSVVPMVYWIDGGSRTEAQARVTRSDTIHIDVIDRESIFQQFRRGLWLNLATQGANGRLSLKGTSVALERLRVCATAIAAAAPREPSEPSELPAVPPPARGK